ncbi:hypothetical protein GOBAR_AA01060 [Gossypium barbadense]|uniref:Uncharacterized protein n=1 Tax=Gossypium barbadense TaxID=3634 RepID=A0A2P5YVE5_GOSBA|nr:hypothetical protein GOBAR_AA01060 [Gossypium barbadense]
MERSKRDLGGKYVEKIEDASPPHASRALGNHISAPRKELGKRETASNTRGSNSDVLDERLIRSEDEALEVSTYQDAREVTGSRKTDRSGGGPRGSCHT